MCHLQLVQQYRQHRKAQLFNDDVRAKQILKAVDLFEQNCLGLKVKHFNNSIWSHKTNVLMHKANYNKFMKNENLKQELLNTAGTTIAQTCPF